MTDHYLHSVIVSYNRPELTERAIDSYLETVTLPYSLWVVDNGSDRPTLAMLAARRVRVLYLDRNRYPGYACNRGWEKVPPEATLLHRGDNDFVYLPNWCDEVVRSFEHNKRLGQLGLRTHGEELFVKTNVGGNNIIRRELWDLGLRYDERPWTEFSPGITEDSFLTPAVENMGWKWTRVREPCVEAISTEDPNDPYYIKTWKDRRIHGKEE